MVFSLPPKSFIGQVGRVSDSQTREGEEECRKTDSQRHGKCGTDRMGIGQIPFRGELGILEIPRRSNNHNIADESKDEKRKGFGPHLCLVNCALMVSLEPHFSLRRWET